MGLSLLASGTTRAIVGTAVTLATSTTHGLYWLVVDVSQLASGEAVTITSSVLVVQGGNNGGAPGAEDTQSFTGAASAPTRHLKSGPVILAIAQNQGLTGGSWTLKQTSGTARNFDWALWQLD